MSAYSVHFNVAWSVTVKTIYFNDNFFKVSDPLVKDIMALAPLWSAATTANGQTLSNAVVENHFRSLKRLSPFGRRLTFAAFISQRYGQIKDKLARLVK